MKPLIKPKYLRPGDTVAAVSLSSGIAGEEQIRWRYEQGKQRLETVFGLKVVEMPHTLAGEAYLSAHPQERAGDLMDAFRDNSIKGIIACIGGEDTIRLLPYIDFDLIRAHPKIFMGYSDTTVNHFMCMKAGLSSFYGPAVLTDFAENVEMSAYTVEHLKRTLFTDRIIGEIPVSNTWSSERLAWLIENQGTARKFQPNSGYLLLQGNGTVQGRLLGGCIGVLEWMKGTCLFPEPADFEDTILFFETSEEKPEPDYIRWWLRSYGAMGVLERIQGMVFGKPYNETYFEAYQREIKQVLREYGRSDMPVLYNASFGHCEPKCCIPFGALAEIRCDVPGFSILESGCIP